MPMAAIIATIAEVNSCEKIYEASKNSCLALYRKVCLPSHYTVCLMRAGTVAICFIGAPSASRTMGKS